MTSTLLYQIALSLINGAGPVISRILVSECGGVREVFEAQDKELLKIPKVSKKIVASIRDKGLFDRAQKELSYIEKNGIHTYFYLDKEFPKRLEFCADAPILLYGKGNLNLNTRKVISVVGTRSCTPYGREMVDKLISELASYNPLIVSGLAMGVDIAAHKSALKHNLQTIGVLAHGVDSIYPPSSRPAAVDMVSNGGVISEFMHGTTPVRENFPNRNRIISGLCDALVIVESKKRGGSIISAELAFGYNREVFAVPGKASDKLSEGCNDLIKYQKAIMVTSGADIAREMNWSAPLQSKQPELFPSLNKSQTKTLEIIRSNAKLSIDEIAEKVGANSSELAQILLELEFNGLIRALPGKVFESA